MVNIDRLNMEVDPLPDEERLVTTAEAARRLGVKPETVYAYVSRGQLHSIRTGRRRESLFDPDEVDRLGERSRQGRSPSGAIERIRTELTLLERDELHFRGRSATELARTHSFESVAHLLWTGELAQRPPFEASAELVDVVAAGLDPLPPTVRLTDRIRVAVAVAAAADPLRYDLSPPSVVRRAESLLAVLVDTLHPAHEGVPRTLASRLWPALVRQPRRALPAEAALLDTILVVLADHDLAVSTLAARVAASARAHPYAVVSAGLGALDGPHHGTASSLAYRFLAEALDDPVRALSDRLRSDAPVPGFGHRIYRHRDPRAELLLAVLRDHDAAAPVLAAVDVVERGLAQRPEAFPNVDLALAAVMHAFDLRSDAGEGVFALARTAGWVAHALEEYREPDLRFRAEGVYAGPRPMR